MCEFEVDDPVSVSHRESRTARKKHRCSECGSTIKPSEIYFHYWWVERSGSKPETAKQCWSCEEAMQLFADHHDGAYWFPGGNLAEELSECARSSETFAEMMMWGRLSVARRRRARAARIEREAAKARGETP